MVKPFNKGSIVVMTPQHYWEMYQSHLNNKQFYRYLFENENHRMYKQIPENFNLIMITNILSIAIIRFLIST